MFKIPGPKPRKAKSLKSKKSPTSRALKKYEKKLKKQKVLRKKPGLLLMAVRCPVFASSNSTAVSTAKVSCWKKRTSSGKRKTRKKETRTFTDLTVLIKRLVCYYWGWGVGCLGGYFWPLPVSPRCLRLHTKQRSQDIARSSQRPCLASGSGFLRWQEVAAWDVLCLVSSTLKTSKMHKLSWFHDLWSLWSYIIHLDITSPSSLFQSQDDHFSLTFGPVISMDTSFVHLLASHVSQMLVCHVITFLDSMCSSRSKPQGTTVSELTTGF